MPFQIFDNQVIPLLPEVDEENELEVEEEDEHETNDARNVATYILDEILDRVVQSKAEVNSLTLIGYSNTSYILYTELNLHFKT